MATTPIGRGLSHSFQNLAISEPRKECPLPKLLSVEEVTAANMKLKEQKIKNLSEEERKEVSQSLQEALDAPGSPLAKQKHTPKEWKTVLNEYQV